LLAPTACTTAYRQRPRYHRASLKQRRGGPRWHADHPRRNRHRRARRPLKAMRCHFGDGAAGPGPPLSAKPLTSFHSALAPPSTGKAIPVTHSASGEVRNSTNGPRLGKFPNVAKAYLAKHRCAIVRALGLLVESSLLVLDPDRRSSR
jgi:hypothetical protein